VKIKKDPHRGGQVVIVVFNYDNYEKRKVNFFGYIAANNISGERNLKKISKLAQKHVIKGKN